MLTSGEADVFVARAKLDVEVGDERVHVIVALEEEVKRRGEGEVGLGHRAYIDLFDEAAVGHDLLWIDNVDERLGERDVAYAAHVEAVHVVPPVHLVLLVVAVLDGADVQRRLVGKHESVGGEPLVARVQHGLQHRLVEQAVAHPLRDDDVHLLDAVGQLDLLDFAANQRNHYMYVVVHSFE